MRIMLHGNYEGEAFVLRKEDGNVYKSIFANTVICIGDYTSYFVKKVWLSKDKQLVALIKLNGNLGAISIPELKRKTRIIKGFILKPGKGLWAISAASARQGVWHLLKNVDNPILIALWSYQLPSKFLQLVEELDCQVYDGGNLYEHSRTGDYCYSYATDGNIAELRRQAYSKPFRGKSFPIREAIIQVIGGTYCIQSIRRKENNGKIYPKVISVIITADANKSEVAELIKKMMS